MKKLTAIVLAFLMVLSVFSACGPKEPEGPVTITIMIESESNGFEYFLSNKLNELYGDSIQIDYVKVRSDHNTSRDDRDMELRRIRAEIIAGKAPDIYILPTETAMMHEGVFTNVNEAMENGIFLPLDDYIAKSQYFNPDDYIKPIYDAGRNEFGQLVVPLLYHVPMIITDKSFTDKLGKNTITLEELLDCGDERTLARAGMKVAFEDAVSLIPGVADYKTWNLSITEEKLGEYYSDISAVVHGASQVENREYYAFNELSEKYGIFSGLSENVLFDFSKYSDELSPLIITNNEGNYVAKINAFTAISANTEHPDEAFKVLELICGGYKTFGDSRVRADAYNIGTGKGISAVKEAYGEKDLIDTEIVRIIEESVTAAEFACDIDDVLSRGRSIYASAVKNGDAEGAEKALSETYTELKMHLAE